MTQEPSSFFCCLSLFVLLASVEAMAAGGTTGAASAHGGRPLVAGNNAVIIVNILSRPHLVESHVVLEHLEEAPQQHPGHDDPSNIFAAFG